MKIISNIFSVILLLVLFSGCGKDNFDAPESKLVGRVTYQGQALNLRGLALLTHCVLTKLLIRDRL